MLLLWLAALTIGLRGAGQMLNMFGIGGEADLTFVQLGDAAADGFKLKAANGEVFSHGKHFVS